jgi:hypothetical protein
MVVWGSWITRKFSEPIPDVEATAKFQEERSKRLGINKGAPPEILKKWTTRSLVLPPHGTYEQLLIRELQVPTPDTKGKFWDTLIMYGIGVITYTDPLTHKIHTTNFCIFNNGADAAFHYCQTGNDMD